MRQQLVDPFIPATGQALQRKVQPASRPAKLRTVDTPKAARRGVSIDGVMPSSVTTLEGARPARPYRDVAGSLHARYRSRQLPPATKQNNSQKVRKDRQLATQVHRQSLESSKVTSAKVESDSTTTAPTASSKGGVSTIWLVVGAAVAGMAMFSVMAGQLAIAVYALLALWRRWPSQQTFALALVMFGGIIVASLLPSFRSVADNLAVYAFLLLCTGTLSLAREVRREARQTAR